MINKALEDARVSTDPAQRKADYEDINQGVRRQGLQTLGLVLRLDHPGRQEGARHRQPAAARRQRAVPGLHERYRPRGRVGLGRLGRRIDRGERFEQWRRRDDTWASGCGDSLVSWSCSSACRSSRTSCSTCSRATRSRPSPRSRRPACATSSSTTPSSTEPIPVQYWNWLSKFARRPRQLLPVVGRRQGVDRRRQLAAGVAAADALLDDPHGALGDPVRGVQLLLGGHVVRPSRECDRIRRDRDSRLRAGLLLAYFVGVKLRWFPTSGYVHPSDNLVKHFKSMVLPVDQPRRRSDRRVHALLRSDMIADAARRLHHDGQGEGHAVAAHPVAPRVATVEPHAAHRRGPQRRRSSAARS